MKPTWLIEAGVYGDAALPLAEEIRRQGMACEVIPHSAIKRGSTVVVAGRPLAADDCVIGYGTYPFARQIQIHFPWKPGAWCNETNFDCATYYPHFAGDLLNEDYEILPGVEALRQRDRLYEQFGR